VSGGTERRNREWDEVQLGAAVLGAPFIGPGDGRGGGAVGERPVTEDRNGGGGAPSILGFWEEKGWVSGE
jgi:hypothetical protein